MMPTPETEPIELVPPRRRVLLLVAVIAAAVALAGGAAIGVLVGWATRDEPAPAASDNVDVVIFLNPRSSPDDEAIVLERLRADPGIRSACFIDTEGAHREFAELFATTPASAKSIKPDDLPVSFRIDVGGDAAAIVRLTQEFQNMPGVREVRTADREAPRLSAQCERFGTKVIG